MPAEDPARSPEPSASDTPDTPDAQDRSLLDALSRDGSPEKTFSTWEKDVFDEELKVLHTTHSYEKGQPLAGLALSGGGVRSAVVCLGVMGQLARKGLMSRFHYLSSVSGGGYAGAAYSHWIYLRQKAFADHPNVVDPDETDHQVRATQEATQGRIDTALFDMACPFNADPVQGRFWEGTPGFEPAFQEAKDCAEDLSAQNNAYIRHLRANISYLMPNGFGSMVAGGYVVLRSILLNVLIWTLLVAGVFQLALFVDDALDGPVIAACNGIFSTPARPEICGTPALARAAPALDGGDGHSALWSWVLSTFAQEPIFVLLAGLGALALALAFLLMPIFSLLTVLNDIPGKADGPDTAPKRLVRVPDRWATWLGYPWRSFNERAAQVLFLSALGLLAVGLIPMTISYLEAEPGAFAAPTPTAETVTLSNPDGSLRRGDAPAPDEAVGAGTLGLMGTILGIAASLFGFVRTRLGGVFGSVSTVVVVLGSVILLGSVAMLAFVLARDLPGPWMASLVLAALALAVLCHVNDVSLGRFYRDRLMEAFLPDADQIQAVTPGGTQRLAREAPAAHQADEIRLLDLEPSPAPLHLVNTNVMAWWSPDSRAQRRKGDNFILSSVTCGSDVTGWRRTRDVSAGRLTLATAMATSGAAVNPMGGFAGQGPTTNPVVSIAMAFLSLRLGYWLQWNQKVWSLSSRYGNHLQPAARMAFGNLLSHIWPNRPTGVPKSSSDHEFLELTDGGHFENLGIYELIRRRCAVILVVDGGEDRRTSYDSFSAALRRVADDFNAKVHFDVKIARTSKSTDEAKTLEASGPQDLVPRKTSDEFPSGVDYATKGYFLARITYAAPEPGMHVTDGFRAHRSDGPSEGLLIYLKSAMIRELDFKTKGYRGVNDQFPYDPTTNQFFSPEQFEAYRDLGRALAEQMMDEVDLDKILSSDDPLGDLPWDVPKPKAKYQSKGRPMARLPSSVLRVKSRPK